MVAGIGSADLRGGEAPVDHEEVGGALVIRDLWSSQHHVLKVQSRRWTTVKPRLIIIMKMKEIMQAYILTKLDAN